jgi:hypothetical protein
MLAVIRKVSSEGSRPGKGFFQGFMGIITRHICEEGQEEMITVLTLSWGG